MSSGSANVRAAEGPFQKALVEASVALTVRQQNRAIQELPRLPKCSFRHSTERSGLGGEGSHGLRPPHLRDLVGYVTSYTKVGLTEALRGRTRKLLTECLAHTSTRHLAALISGLREAVRGEGVQGSGCSSRCLKQLLHSQPYSCPSPGRHVRGVPIPSRGQDVVV